MKFMSIEEGVQHVMSQLTDADIEYAKSNGGFAGLHDICDANMLLPHVDDIENFNDEVCGYFNSIMDAFNAKVLS